MTQEKNKKRNVPNLRFPEFSGEWERYKLGDMLKRFINKVDVIKDEDYYQIGIRSDRKSVV